MDILHLIDRLEELLNESRPIWFTHSVVMDEERMLDIIDQMRVSIPEEIKKAQRDLAQRDRIMAQAQEEANRIVAIAQEKSQLLVENHSIVQQATQEGERIKAQARAEADITRREADEYVLETLNRMETEMERSLSQVRNGIRTLKTDMQAKGYTADKK